MRQILIPTDFSQNSWNAIQYALQFFKTDDVIFHFLHITTVQNAIKTNDLYSAGISRSKSDISNAHLEMDELIGQVTSGHSKNNFQYKSAIVPSLFIDGIRSYIEHNAIELVVMGTKGASGIKEITVGSKTGAVITKVKCPILVIPEKAKFKTPLQIGFPTDFNLHYNHKVIETLLSMAQIYSSSIKVLRVAQAQKPLTEFQSVNRDFLKEQFQGVGHSFHLVEGANLENTLQSFVTSMKIDMVAMIAKNLNFFQQILFKPKVAKLSYHMLVPFLVLHE